MFSKVIECLEQSIRKQIDCKKPSQNMRNLENISHIALGTLLHYKPLQYYFVIVFAPDQFYQLYLKPY